MKTVCVWPVLVAPVLWLMAKAAISRSSGLWVNNLQSMIDGVKIRAKHCTQVSHGHCCFFRSVSLFLHTLRTPCWLTPPPSANLDCYNGEPILTCAIYRLPGAPHPTRKVKRKHHRVRNSINLITQWKLERKRIPLSFQKRTIWMPYLFGKVLL